MLHAERPCPSGLAQKCCTLNGPAYRGLRRTDRRKPRHQRPRHQWNTASLLARFCVSWCDHGWCGTRPQRRGSCSGYPHPAACPVWRAGSPSPGRMQVRLNASCPARWSCLSWLSPGRALRTTPRQNPHGCGRGGLPGLRPGDADAPPCKARPPSRGGPIHGRSLQGRGVGAGIGEFCRYICWRSSGRCSSVLPCR